MTKEDLLEEKMLILADLEHDLVARHLFDEDRILMRIRFKDIIKELEGKR